MSDSQSDNPIEEGCEDNVNKPGEGVTADADTSAFSKSEQPEQLSFLDEPDVFTPGDFPDEPVEPEMLPLDTCWADQAEPSTRELYGAASDSAYEDAYVQNPPEHAEESFVQDSNGAPSEPQDAGYTHADAPGMVIRRVRTESSDMGAKPKERGFLYTLLDTTRFISLGLVIGILLVVGITWLNS